MASSSKTNDSRPTNKQWTSLHHAGAPLPRLYSSPLTRCLQTTTHIFSPLFAPPLTFAPTVKELLREQMTDHTCDRRSSATYIKAHFPAFRLEPGFSERDELWRADYWETMEEHVARKYRVLCDLFGNEDGAWLGLTVHSFAIAAILTVVGAEVYRVREGTSLGVLVKAEKVGDRPVIEAGKLVGY